MTFHNCYFRVVASFDMAIRGAPDQAAFVQIRSLRGDLPCSALKATDGR
jgi:hypothetical protein